VFGLRRAAGGTWQWDVLPALAQGRMGAAVAAVGGRIWVFGGYDLHYEGGQRQVKVFGDAWVLDPGTGKWERLPDAPQPLYGGAAAVVGERWVVIGGGVVESAAGDFEQSVQVDSKRRVLLGEYSRRVLLFDTATRRYAWQTERMPRGHNDLRMVTSGGKLYAVGGENADPTLSNTTNDVMVGSVES
jgi:N-acetylneuraminic acid mutarotase